jgi:CBS domain-containing protein
MLTILVETEGQDVFPVLDETGKPAGLVTAEALQVVAIESDEMSWILASDLMQPWVSVRLDDDLRTAGMRLLANGIRQIPVMNDAGTVVALLDETDISEWHLGDAQNPTKTPIPPSRPSWGLPQRWKR